MAQLDRLEGEGIEAWLGRCRAAFRATLVDRSDSFLRCPECDLPQKRGAHECPRCAERIKRARDLDEKCARLTAFYEDAEAKNFPHFPFASFDNQDWLKEVDPAIVKAVRAWEPGQGLLLLGPTGKGKTTSLRARIRELAPQWIGRYREAGDPNAFYPAPPYWVSEAEIIDHRLRRKLGEEEPGNLSSLRTVRHLIIDEMGFQQDSFRIVADILNSRYERGLSTVATSGRSLDELIAHYGDATVRRLTLNAKVFDLYDRPKEKLKSVK